MIRNMIRKAFVMQLYKGHEAEYERRHNPIPAALERALQEGGVQSYSIFLHAATGQLFAYAEIEDEARWNAVAQTLECQEWWAFMRDLMETNSDNSPCSMELRPVFHL